MIYVDSLRLLIMLEAPPPPPRLRHPHRTPINSPSGHCKTTAMPNEWKMQLSAEDYLVDDGGEINVISRLTGPKTGHLSAGLVSKIPSLNIKKETHLFFYSPKLPLG